MIKIGYKGEDHILFLHDIVNHVKHTSDNNVRVYVDLSRYMDQWIDLELVLTNHFGYSIDNNRRTGPTMLERRLSSPVFKFNLTVITYA